jgi:hypothetical protein
MEDEMDRACGTNEDVYWWVSQKERGHYKGTGGFIILKYILER